MEFVYEQPAARVVFGVGALDRVPDELAALGVRRALVIAGGSAGPAGDRLAARLGPAATRFAEVAPHVPTRPAAAAQAAAEAHHVDGVCSIGGGSATGLAKAVAVAVDAPILAVPTTYAGSEATSAYGVTGEGDRKRVTSDPRARPRIVVYDPSLTTGLSARATAASAFNALAHAAAALAGPESDPFTRLAATEAIRTIAAALPNTVWAPDDLTARAALLRAAWLAGTSLAGAGGGIHHRLCHAVGGRYGLPHAEVHAVLLPHTLARDEALTGPGRQMVAAALAGAQAADDAPARLRALAAALGGLPDSLAALGLPADGLDQVAADAADTISPDHPRHKDVAWFRALLTDAYHPKETSS